jgi:putative ABC transport system permease protein
LVAALLGSGLAASLSYLLTGWISERYHIALAPGLPLGTLALGLVLPVCTAVLFVLPQLALLARTSPASLLLPAEPKPLPRLMRVGFFALQMAWIVCMARLLSHSWVLAGWAWVAWFAAWVAIGSISIFLSAALWRLRTLWGYADRVLLGSLRQRPTRALTAFFALGFTTFALALLPILRQSLAKELASPTGQSLPSLFLFDVQEEQEADIRLRLASLSAPLQSLSPMVRARLMKVNGKSFKRDSSQIKTLEDRKQQQMRNRGFNLSYRDSLSSSETLLEGTWWRGPASDTGLAEISIEKRFAGNLNLQLRDTLTFDVQGIEVSGRITSFRRVKWNSFQPNFFVMFQPGVLEDAPKTFIGTVIAPGPQSARIRDTLVKAHPNISVMEVGDAIQRLDDLMGQLQSMVGLLSWGYLLIGLGILAMVVESSARDSQRSLLLLRAIGATPPTLIWAGARHYAVFTLAATVAGLLMALGVSAAILRFVWDLPFTPPLQTVLYALLAGMGLAAASATVAAWRLGRGELRSLLSSTRGE